MALGAKAHTLYGQTANSGQLITAAPRSKFNFTASMDTIDGPVFLERIANVTMPSYSARTQTLNSYNKKKIVQTGVDYSPIVLTAYDTKDAYFENFLKDYSNYYYAGTMNTDSLTEHNLQGKGFKLQQDSNYIKTLVITRVDSLKEKQINIITIFNPTIAQIDSDTLDYSDSSLVQYRINIVYEGFDIKTAKAQ